MAEWINTLEFDRSNAEMPYYERQHSENKATAKTLIYDRFRSRESLNGEWKDL